MASSSMDVNGIFAQRRMIAYAANGFSSAVGPYTDGTD